MKQRSSINIMGRLVGLVKPLLPFMLLAIAMGVIGFFCAIFITVFGGYAMVNVLGLSVPISIGTIFVLVVIFALLRGILHYGEQACNHYIAFKLLALIRDKVFKALRKLAPAKLEGRDKGNLISIITSDIELLEVFYAHTISPIAIAIIVSAIMTVFIGSFHAVQGVLAVIAYLSVGVIVPIIASRANREITGEYRAQFGDMNSFFLDSLRGLKEIIQYNTGTKRLEDIDGRTDKLSLKEERIKENTAQNSARTGAVILIFSMIMFFISIALFHNGKVGFEGLIIPTIAMMSSFGPVTALANLGTGLSQTLAAGDRVLDILDEEPVTADVTGKEDIEFTGASCDRVSFAYDKELILDEMSLNIPQGEIVGISGKSGSGKSTLLRLLMRFWEADRGTISISGTNISHINTSNLRDMESFVTQETQLFSDTIENNVKIAKLDATREEVEEACKKASIHDFIMTLPEGYHTNVGELGDTLSGGERQRLGIARAFLHNAPLILLDEPTSNLDSLNEAVILKSLREKRDGKTVVIVSHRKSTMEICDREYSAQNGRVS